MMFSRFAAIVALSAGLAACASEPTCDYTDAPYMAARNAPPLKVPEGMAAPDRSAMLTVPDISPTAPPAPSGKGKCLDRPPSYFATSTATTTPVGAAPEKKAD